MNKGINNEATIINVDKENSAQAATAARKPKEKVHKAKMLTNMIEEPDSGMDLFGEGFGIKILDEIFLCSQCHKELSQEDLDVIFQANLKLT